MQDFLRRSIKQRPPDELRWKPSFPFRVCVASKSLHLADIGNSVTSPQLPEAPLSHIALQTALALEFTRRVGIRLALFSLLVLELDEPQPFLCFILHAPR